MNKKSSRSWTYTGVGMAIGLILGGLIGLTLDNIPVFAGGGMIVGFALGYALDNRK